MQGPSAVCTGGCGVTGEGRVTGEGNICGVSGCGEVVGLVRKTLVEAPSELAEADNAAPLVNLGVGCLSGEHAE
jgi:hypothetical protein